MNKNPTVLLVNPPIYDFALYDLFHKPLGLLRIAQWFKDQNYNIELLDCMDPYDNHSIEILGPLKRKKNGTGKFFRQIVELPPSVEDIRRKFSRYGIHESSIEEKLKNSHADLVLVTTGMTYWYLGVQEIITTIRKFLPGIPIAAGGIYASLMPDHCLSACKPDYVLPGDIFPAILPVLEKIGLPLPLSGPGPRPMDHPTWKDAGILRLNEGCPFHCDYCGSNALCSGFIQGNPNIVANQIIHWNKLYGTSHFAFYDDALLVNAEKGFIPLMERVKREFSGLSFYTPNALHIRYLDIPMLKLMKDVGFKEIRMGFESSDEDFHKQHDTKLSEGMFEGMIRQVKTSGFPIENCHVYVLAGLPGQHWEEVEETVRYASSFGVRCRIAEFSTVPKSGLWERCLKECKYPIKEEPLFHNNTFFPMESEIFSRERLEYLKSLSLELYRLS